MGEIGTERIGKADLGRVVIILVRDEEHRENSHRET